ncbi:hypothetical protein FHW67_002726 [Herbaspirillum sp. Sphag1AN]|nr:hypothetical protein [Herbaspirillum sp. Sphag1AN]
MTKTIPIRSRNLISNTEIVRNGTRTSNSIAAIAHLLLELNRTYPQISWTTLWTTNHYACQLSRLWRFPLKVLYRKADAIKKPATGYRAGKQPCGLEETQKYLIKIV